MSEIPWSRILPIAEVDTSRILEFSCGSDVIDKWFHNSAINDNNRFNCSVHVCVDGAVPIAFFTLSSAVAHPDKLSKSMAQGYRSDMPATLLGKMGVDILFQGGGCGTHLLNHAKLFALQSAELSSSKFLMVDALNNDLVPWYEKRGFTKIDGMERRLVCKMSTIKKLRDNLPEDYLRR